MTEGYFSEEEREQKRVERLAQEITADFERRREERRSIENGWVLNMQFLCGNQYCDVSPFGGTREEDRQFYWQSRRVFNHVAPTVEARIAKLEKLRPNLQVRAFSDEDGDLKSAKLATGILAFVRDRIGFSEIVSKATAWSETCGSAFYKVTWDDNGGRRVAVGEDGAPVFEGEVSVTPVAPFEIFPDSLATESVEELDSVIHARAVTCDYVYGKFGVAVKGEPMSGLVLKGYAEPSSGKLPFVGGATGLQSQREGVMLIERYTKPDSTHPDGRLEIVAGGKLLYEGVLPYKNGERGERVFPFIKQDCIPLPGAFFGASVIDRLIPIQRAYNAVRNRKHEFLNRLSLGVLTVEDGSVDIDELAEEGLQPGKVLVYRQGGKAPELLDTGNIPAEFAAEEAWLEKEFAMISGVSDLSQNSTPVRVTSATGLQLLLSQDESRLAATVVSIERALKEASRHILRLYRQFAGTARLMTLTGEDKRTQVYYFNAADLAVNDVQFEAQDATSPEEKRATLLKLYEAGILTDGDGKLSAENKNRVLEAFGFGSYENARDISSLHINKASEENIEMRRAEVEVDEYDDHGLHITEHTRFLLSAEWKRFAGKEEVKRRYLAHIKAHKEALKKEE